MYPEQRHTVAKMFLMLYFASLFAWSAVAQKPNFLLIIVDDLRTSLGCYGDPNARTPNIDRLAKEGAIFSQAYSQQALCAPSRNSFLTSRRPDTLRLYDFYSYWRENVGNFTTLPQHLKEHGYVTKSVGKVFHPGISSNGSDDSPYSWSEKPFHPYTNKYKNARVCQSNASSVPSRNLVCPVNVPNMPNSTLPDIEIVEEAARFLRDHASNPDPFLLAVGFQKPHIPLKYPEEYQKYHPIEKFHLPVPYGWPENLSAVAYNPWTDLRKREDVESLHLKFPWERIPVSFGKQIMQSYYAAVTYIDALIGKLINHLESYSFRQNTVILLTSDHGWSLGEHGIWAKYSNFDVAVKVPLIISLPTLVTNNWPRTSSQLTPVVVDAIVELVDIFPTIADLAGIPIPICSEDINVATCSEGISFVPPLRFATNDLKSIAWKKAAFSQYPRPGLKPTWNPNSDEPRLEEISIMGYTLKTLRYRYTAWLRFMPDICKPDWSMVHAEELYDHDSDAAETRNLAAFEKYSSIKSSLRVSLIEGWSQALPGLINLGKTSR